MSRESYEVSREAFVIELLGRGPGDPDLYGYPGETTVQLVHEPLPVKPF